MSEAHARMVGEFAGDPHKNTARSKRVNDRERRRRKRTEEAAFESKFGGCYRKAG